MQHKKIDICITGTDRTASNGDVCNKIGTYLKALAAYDNNIPFYVSAPISSIDFNIKNDPSATPMKRISSPLKAGKLKASWKKAKGKLKACERQAKSKLKAC